MDDINPKSPADAKALEWAMRVSLLVGFLMLAMKGTAWWMTGSAAILSDAAESVVHVVAVSFAYYSLRLSLKPADESHPYGHAKISYFSAGFEGALIILAAIYIIYESIHRWTHGLEINNIGKGTLLTAAAVLINGLLGVWLVVRGRRKKSLILEANGKHVLTDVWTSAGVLLGLGLVMVTGWLPFDPICAILMALNILWTGFGLMRQAWTGLMDAADPVIRKELVAILDRETAYQGIQYHGLRHRNSGNLHWVEVHLIFPNAALLQEAHHQATIIEGAISKALAGAVVTTHLETKDDHESVHEMPHA